MTITREQLSYLAGIADGLTGTGQSKTVEEARHIGKLMQDLVREVAQLSNVENPLAEAWVKA